MPWVRSTERRLCCDRVFVGLAMKTLADIVATSRRVTATRARSVKIRELAELLRALDPTEIESAVAWLSGELTQGRIGIGYAALQDAASVGEPGASWPILDLERELAELATIRGAGATARRAATLQTLFARASVEERAFLIALLAGELRQGALAGVMLDAIAAASQVPVQELRRAAMYAPSLGAAAKVALLEGAQALVRFQMELLTPLAPMLAQTAVDAAEALEQLGGTAAFEWKMDGARIQVHKAAREVRIYTRSLNDVTAALPEVVEALQSLGPHQLILDGEVMTFHSSGRPNPFQTTMRRFGRKLDVEGLRHELPVRPFFFDCLRRDATSLADRPLQERYVALADSVPAAMLIPRLITSSAEQAQAFYDAAIDAGHEGIMAKALDAPYEAGNRGASWLKIKRAHTLDLVVLAAEWGHGRRIGKLSNLHLGALDTATGEYVMLGKTFKGLTDALLEWQTRELLARQVRADQWTVYVRPELVVEIAFSDLQASPRYPGGLALRLARVKRYRSDKRVEDADTMDAVRRIFAAQSG